MNYYETLYIIHPALESGRLKDIIASTENHLTNLGAKILSTNLWGKKRLAYLIDKQKYGTYIQLQFKGPGSCSNKLGMELEHNPNILSYLTTSINANDVDEQEQDIDAQIAGQLRSSTASESSSKNINNDEANDETQKTDSTDLDDIIDKKSDSNSNEPDEPNEGE